ncbi:uncharacterized protein LOC126554465 [Aphis gossypii]|uniref:uncharacterized protein LOC126554465 n=1 Tax=Aphis gossypii TaxID=80765 RepID=UPI002158B976|nr:uncharacterized protein LOC126554465 [Aphis gossypii]
MSVLKNVEDIANFIQQKYPSLEFGNISFSNEAISDISKVIFKKADCKKAKNNLVKSLNNPNSALRKLLDRNSTVGNKSHFDKMLHDKGYSKNDFCIYKTEVVNSICKILKIDFNPKNQHRIFQRCRESFRQNEISVSPKEIVISDEGNNTSNIIVDELGIDLKENVFEIKECDLNSCNPGLLYSSCKVYDDCCSTIEEIDNQHTIFQHCRESFQEYEISDNLQELSQKEIVMLGETNKLNESTAVGKKRFKSVSICNTPEADLKTFPKNSKNVYPLKVRSFNEDNKMKKVMCYKKCNFVEGTISLQDKE